MLENLVFIFLISLTVLGGGLLIAAIQVIGMFFKIDCLDCFGRFFKI
jgi:hypothetical protein